jgi:hypothetical protein
MIYLNFLTWAIAVSAFTYSNILTEEGMLLYGFHGWAENRFYGPFRWVFQILINCQFCISGQWALWYYLIYALHRSDYDLFTHVWFILQTIFIAKVITWLYYTVFKF